MAEITVTLNPADIEAIAQRVASLLSAAPSVPAGPSKVLWSEEEAAELFSVSHGSLKRWRLRGFFAAATSSRPVLYSREHIENAAKWIAGTGRGS